MGVLACSLSVCVSAQDLFLFCMFLSPHVTGEGCQSNSWCCSSDCTREDKLACSCWQEKLE